MPAEKVSELIFFVVLISTGNYIVLFSHFLLPHTNSEAGTSSVVLSAVFSVLGSLWASMSIPGLMNE